MQQVETKREVRQSLSWIGQAVSGLLLIVIVLLHMLLHHFQAGGLLSADEVIRQVSNPALSILEISFVVVVTYHALVGIRAVIFDLSLSDSARRTVSRLITIVGIVTVVYGVIIAVLIRSQTPV